MAELLKKMSLSHSVSGNESEIRNLIIKEIKDYTDDIQIDSMGNIIALKKGTGGGKTIAAAAGMDEAGFIVSGITDSGYLKFKPVGNIDPRKIVSKRVITEKGIRGVIGMKAIHLQTASEREDVVCVSKLFIDIGAKDKKNAEKTVDPGDYVTFDTQFEKVGKHMKGKALDRSGACMALIQALKSDLTHDVYACFLVQQEVGARGAQIAAHRLNADAVLMISSMETNDMFGCNKNSGGIKLGEGAAVIFTDKSILPDRELTRKFAELIKDSNIKMQTAAVPDEMSSAGAMQRGADGAVCINIAIPCRYARSPVSVMSESDINCASAAVNLFFNKIGEFL